MLTKLTVETALNAELMTISVMRKMLLNQALIPVMALVKNGIVR